jgi:hypothetical protein
MTAITGTDLAKAIEQFTEQQTAQAQEAYSLLIAKLVSEFTLKYEVPVQSGAVSAISRLIKSIDDDSVRQIRALSEALLRAEEVTLRKELLELQSQLSPASSQTHQVKTRSAFITTILRPFDFKYAKRWLEERKDIDTREIREQIENLERRSLESPSDLFRWTSEVLELFNKVVVFRGEEADQYYLRPAGTISPKSARTYEQAWSTFIGMSLAKVFDQAVALKRRGTDDRTLYSMGSPSGKMQVQNKRRSSAKIEVGLSQSPPEEIIISHELNSPVRAMPPRVASVRSKSAWIKVDLASLIEPTAQASRKWDSRNSFYESLDSWISSLGEIWGPASFEMTAKISVKTDDGDSELTIPNVSIDDAERRISQTVELLQRT